MATCAQVWMKDSLSRRVVKNGPLAIGLGFVVACSCCGLFALQLLPGFTRFHWGGWPWSTWSLFGGSLTTLVAFLWRPCFKTREQAALEEVNEVENGEQAPPEPEVNPWLGLVSVTGFLTVLAAMVPVTVAPADGSLLPLIGYLLLAGCINSCFTAAALRRHMASLPGRESKGHFSRVWMISVSSPLCWAFMDVAVSFCRTGLYEPALEYSIYGGIIWLVVAPSMWRYFLWLAQSFPIPSERCCSSSDLLATGFMVVLALPPVLGVCGCFLLAREWGSSPLIHAVLFSGMMLAGCLVPQLIMACQRWRAAASPGASKGKQAEQL